MKAKAWLFSISLSAFLCGYAAAEQEKTNAPAKIAAVEARLHVGEEIIVAGKIAEINRTDKLLRLNFDKPFPHQSFTAVIFAEKTNLFPDVSGLNGKLVEVQGKITEFRGRPQMVLSRTNQLRSSDQK